MKHLYSCIVLSILAACSTFGPHRAPETADRPVPAGTEPAGPPPMWEHYTSPDFYVGTIEFTDLGKFHAQAAAETVLDNIDRLADAEGATIAVFAHGWHHNGTWKDRDQENFRRFLGSLAALQDATFATSMKPLRTGAGFKVTKRPPVIGLALAWRGESLKIPYVNVLTFYGRKTAAHRIGGNRMPQDLYLVHATAAREVIRRLDDIYRRHNTATKLTSMTLVGHSFGGALLFSATEQYLRGELEGHQIGESASLTAYGEGKSIPRICGLGDAVILVNPAFESRLYRPFGRLTDHPLRFNEYQTPKLMIFSSNHDWPNRWAFPIGRYLTHFTWPPSWTHWAQERTAVGFHHSDQTHWLHLDCRGAECPADTGTLQFDTADRVHLEHIAKAPETFDVTTDEDHSPEKLERRDTRKFLAHTPFMVVRTSRSVIPGHSDIFTGYFNSFLVKYVAEIEIQNTKIRGLEERLLQKQRTGTLSVEEQKTLAALGVCSTRAAYRVE